MKKSKYKAKKTTIDNIVFDSKREAERYSELKMMKKAKEPKDRVVKLELQPKFPVFINKIKVFTYIADFKVKYADGRIEIEDVKGILLPIFRLKSKCVEAYYGIKIKVVK